MIMIRKMKNSGIEWIGDIPEAWRISRIKYVADFDPSCDFSMLSPDSVITYTPMENIKNGYYIPNTAVLGSLSTSLTAYRDNDIVMAKVTPCFENGNIAVMSGLSSGVGLGSSELFVFRVKGMQTRYLFYWLQNHAFVEQAKATMTGTGGLKRVSPQFVRDCAIHCPPVDEQSRIADYLDIECAQIDAVIEQTRASIEEYRKLKQSVITQAVTKGIRPGRKMKASGVEWIGKIAEEFELKKLKYVCEILDQYRSPITADQRNQDAEVLYDYYGASGAIDKIDGYTIDDHVMLIGEDGANLRMRNLPLMYEVNGKAWINNHAHILKPRSGMDFYYLFFALESLDINPYITGSAQPKLSQDNLKNIWLPVPALDEQIEIAVYIKEQAIKIESLIGKKRLYLSELESYKKSLIFEYVTGKKEVCQ